MMEQNITEANENHSSIKLPYLLSEGLFEKQKKNDRNNRDGQKNTHSICI